MFKRKEAVIRIDSLLKVNTLVSMVLDQAITMTREVMIKMDLLQEQLLHLETLMAKLEQMALREGSGN